VEIRIIQKFLASVFPVYDCEYGTCKVIVHTLTATNVNRKEMVSVELMLLSLIFNNDVMILGTVF
jgi:hypothetical protein